MLKPPIISYNRGMKNCKRIAGQAPPADIYNKAGGERSCGCGLRTVIIPKARGGSSQGQPCAPVLGGYRNTILVYAADGAVYLYDDEGRFTSLTGNQLLPVLEELQRQMAEVESKTNTTSNNLDQEIQNRQTAQAELRELIETLQTQLATETTAREEGDQSLRTDLDALEGKFAASSGDVAAEAKARTDADANLQEQISSLSQELATETQNRANADTAIDTQVTDLSNSVQNLASQVQESTGKIANLPNDILQSVDINPGDNNINILANTLNLTTGESSSTTSSVSFKTINGESIIGEGDLEISGGGGGKFYSDWGDNEDGGLTQKFLSDKLNGRSIFLGSGATSPYYSDDNSFYPVVIGAGSTVNNQNSFQTSVIVGPEITSYGQNDIVIGMGSIGNNAIIIGNGSNGYGTYTENQLFGTIIGNNSKSYANSSIALGDGVTIDGASYSSDALGNASGVTSSPYSVALGDRSKVVNRSGTVSIGDGSSDTDYGTRYLANVRAGELDTDAVNVKQMQDYVAEHAGNTGPTLYTGFIPALSLEINATTKFTATVTGDFANKTPRAVVSFNDSYGVGETATNKMPSLAVNITNKTDTSLTLAVYATNPNENTYFVNSFINYIVFA